MKNLLILLFGISLFSVSFANNIKRTLASVNELDVCHDQSILKENMSESCLNILASESDFLVRESEDSVKKEMETGEPADHEKVARDLMLNQRKKGQRLYEQIKIAKDGYRDFEKNNLSKIKQAKKDFKSVRNLLKTDTIFAKELKKNYEFCKSAKNEKIHDCLMEKLGLQIKEKLPELSKNYAFTTRKIASNENTFLLGCSATSFAESGTNSWHAVLYGESYLDCRVSNSSSMNREDLTFGIGLYGANEYNLNICTSNIENKTVQVGTKASASFLLGVTSSITVGTVGMCLEIGLSNGLGAVAGLTIQKYSK